LGVGDRRATGQQRSNTSENVEQREQALLAEYRAGTLTRDEYLKRVAGD